MIRFYEAKIVNGVEHNSYIVRASSVSEAHDKALTAAISEAATVGVEPEFMPRVKSVEEFCGESAVIL